MKISATCKAQLHADVLSQIGTEQCMRLQAFNCLKL